MDNWIVDEPFETSETLEFWDESSIAALLVTKSMNHFGYFLTLVLRLIGTSIRGWETVLEGEASMVSILCWGVIVSMDCFWGVESIGESH